MAYLFREHIYKNNFTCSCGQVVHDPYGKRSVNDTHRIRRGNDLFCSNCNQKIGRIIYVPKSTITSKLMGDFDIYKQNLQNRQNNLQPAAAAGSAQ